MTSSSIDRDKRIIEHVQERGNATIQELADVFGVSNMTIHRDLNKLTASGILHKKHGGVSLVDNSSNSKKEQCAMCNKATSTRTVFIVQLENGDQKHACCAHCGLMLQTQMKKVSQSLTADYLHGHMISATQAIYVFGSDLNICCVPSVLSFGSQQDAEKFQKGFGGKLASMKNTIQYLQGTMYAR
jgi:DeoR family transcriptional regulator, copper-sensing transcriptional repressor